MAPLRVGSSRRSTRSPAGRWGDAKRGVSTFLHCCRGAGDPRKMLCWGMQLASRRDVSRPWEEVLHCWRWRDGGSCAGSESF